MSTSERIVVMAAAALAACASLPSSPGKPPAFGAAVSAEEIVRSDISIPPSGAGLPAGSGTAKQGAVVYGAKCIACHGEKGAGKPADALVGGIGSLATARPVRTVGSYWPYATTLFDYLRRAIKSKDPPTGSERPPRIKLLSRSRILSNPVFIKELILNSDVGSNSFDWNRCLNRDKTRSGNNSETKEVTRTTSKPARLTLCVSSRDLYLRTWRA